MTGIKLFYRRKILVGIESKGHSGYSEAGSDIICASVSSLMQALLLGLVQIAGLENYIDYFADGNVPIMRMTWPEKIVDEKISLLTKTICESLKIIGAGNPEYIKVMEVDL